jgi:hypothetical protein
MKKNRKTYLALLFLTTVLAYAFVFMPSGNTKVLADSLHISGSGIIEQMENYGGTMEEIRIDGWVKVNCDCMSLQDLQRHIVKLSPLSNGNTQDEIFSEKTDSRQISMTLDQDGVIYNFTIYNRNLHHDKADSWEAYVIANSTLNSDCIQKEEQVYKVIQELLSKLGSDPSVATTYTAVIQEKLPTGKMEQIGRGFIKSLQGRITEGIKDSDWISFTGYSNRLGGGLESEKGRFNINVAVRYHSSEGKTYIRVGTPIIAIPY